MTVVRRLGDSCVTRVAGRDAAVMAMINAAMNACCLTQTQSCGRVPGAPLAGHGQMLITNEPAWHTSRLRHEAEVANSERRVRASARPHQSSHGTRAATMRFGPRICGVCS